MTDHEAIDTNPSHSAMKHGLSSVLLPLVAGAFLAAYSSAQGRIVLACDDWTLSNAGFTNSPTAAQFALNVADWFTCGQPGNFLVRSNNFALTQSMLSTTMTGAGHTWTINAAAPDNTVDDLLPYDAVFLCQTTTNQATLTAYVQEGGCVYIAAGVPSDATVWDTFLGAFGLDLGDTTGLLSGNFPISSSHPLFLGVSSLYHLDGNAVIDLQASDTDNQVLVSSDAQGLYGIYDGQPRCCVDPPAGMVAWWPLDEQSGNIAHDIEGTHNAVFDEFVPVDGMVDGATFVQYQFGTVPHAAQLNLSGDFSFDCWIRVTHLGGHLFYPVGVVGKVGTDGYIFGYDGWTTEPKLWVGWASTEELHTAVGTPLAPTTVSMTADPLAPWRHLAITMNRTTSQSRIYVDGQLVSTMTHSPVPAFTNAEDLFINGPTTTEGGWVEVDEIELFDRELTALEVAQLFGANSEGKCKSCPNVDDVLEENDTCAEATAVGFVSYTNLYVSKFDTDWYRMSVPGNHYVHIETPFSHAAGNIDLRLYNSCTGTLLTQSASVDDDEKLLWGNSLSGPTEVFLHVQMNEDSETDCNTYALTWWTSERKLRIRPR